MLWYVGAAAVWIAVSFVMCWLWGSLARFSNQASDERETLESSFEPVRPVQAEEDQAAAIPLPTSRQVRR